MSSTNPRKRAAPGATPAAPLQQMPPLPQAYGASQNDQATFWNSLVPPTADYGDPPSNLGQFVISPSRPDVQQVSTALARRQPNQALVSTSHANDQWGAYGNGSIQGPGAFDGPADGEESIAQLEQRAQRVKKEAEGGAKTGKKQLPPFVLKLLSFVEDPKNFDLIRWSEKGDSFVVIDEDGFEKKLIPELFKHQKYASFVRQLNMYGFHKRVGLSDNSMKASERKSKAPSEYHHQYFRRGHPSLLWLITKPKSKSSKKGKKEDESADSGEEGMEETFGGPAGQPKQAEAGPLQTKDLQVVRETMSSLKQQQQQISGLISRLRQEQNALYQQAVVFQKMHERHENSINAILSFLANVFRKQLEEQGGTQNVQDLLSSIIPNTQIPQGSVVDLGDFSQQQAQAVPALNLSPVRRTQRLLPPIPAGKASTVVSPSPNPSPAAFSQGAHLGPMGSVTELGDADTPSPSYLQQDLQANPHEGMMRIIQDTNAGASPGIDLPQMAARTTVNLSDDQRNRMIGMMSRPPPAQASPPAAAAVGSSPGGSPSALMSLSPLMSTAVPPSLSDIQARQQDLEHVHRLQKDQRAKIEGLENILGPLSPSGRVTPISNSGELPSGFFDSDQLFDPSAFNDLGDFGLGDFGGGPSGNPDGSDFNFSLDTGYGGDPNNHWSSAAAGDASSPALTEEITREDVDESPSGDAKRRRVG